MEVQETRDDLSLSYINQNSKGSIAACWRFFNYPCVFCPYLTWPKEEKPKDCFWHLKQAKNWPLWCKILGQISWSWARGWNRSTAELFPIVSRVLWQVLLQDSTGSFGSCISRLELHALGGTSRCQECKCHKASRSLGDFPLSVRNCGIHKHLGRCLSRCHCV